MGIIPLAGVGGAHAFDFSFDFAASRGSGVQPQAFDFAFDFAFLPEGHPVLSWETVATSSKDHRKCAYNSFDIMMSII